VIWHDTPSLVVLNKFARAAYKLLRSHPRLKSLVMLVLQKTGLRSLAAPHLASVAVDVLRAEVAARHLRGSGLEIGAMHKPLPVHRDVNVQYVDVISKPEAVRRFPNLDPSYMVTPDIIEDGFTLSSVPERSQDFLIANHVLEHSPNPLQALQNWTRVLRPGGVLYVTVPVAEKCFDRGRLETPIDHMVEDYRLCRESQLDEFRERNRPHYEEWVRVSLPNIAREERRESPLRSPGEIADEVEQLVQSQAEIHFHTFSRSSYEALLAAFGKVVQPGVQIAEIVDLGGEVIAILRKDHS
jgi:SAM-dependent methyltransferase